MAFRDLSATEASPKRSDGRVQWFRPKTVSGAYFLKGFCVNVHRTDAGTIGCLAPERCELCEARLPEAELLYAVLLLIENPPRQALCEFHAVCADRLRLVEPGRAIRLVAEGGACRLVSVGDSSRSALPIDYERYLQGLWAGRRARLQPEQQPQRPVIFDPVRKVV